MEKGLDECKNVVLRYYRYGKQGIAERNEKRQIVRGIEAD